MKYFFEPAGQFAIKIPTDWQYQNLNRGEPETSPFSFGTYDGDRPWGFQISCYPLNDGMRKHIEKKTMVMQQADTDGLEFKEMVMTADGFTFKLWSCIVEDHWFSVKFIYDEKADGSNIITRDLKDVKAALATLVYISPDKRHQAIAIDRVDKFIASLGASFDLKIAAVEKGCYMEALIITANQIDAYLRMAILLEKQLRAKSNDVDLTLIYQPNNAKPNERLIEHKVYDMAFDLEIISKELHARLKTLYSARNKVVHQYIITDLKTSELLAIARDYELMHDEVCQILAKIEGKQLDEGIGIYGNGKCAPNEIPQDYLKVLHASVNDKHSSKERNRKV